MLPEFFDQAFIRSVADSVQTFGRFQGERRFFGADRKRFCSRYEWLPDPVRVLIDACYSPEFIEYLEQMTGERRLMADPELFGGGIHSVGRGGFLKLHADFNRHPSSGLFRRLNLLVYLNDFWDSRWGGALEFWNADLTKCEQRILPVLNTLVVFTTDDLSWHGHPDPLTCPRGRRRNSIALYYYSPDQPEARYSAERKSTDYRPRFNGDIVGTQVSLTRRILNRFRAAVSGSQDE